MILFIIFKIFILSEIDDFIPVDIDIWSNINNEVGKKGAILFNVDYYYDYFFDVDIKRETIFKMNIFDENNKSYEVGCGLWINDRLLVFCELDESIPKGEYLFKFNEEFNYSKYEIHLISYSEFKITKIDSDKIDIYSGNQTINVDDDKEIYELKFKIISYNQEQLFLLGIEPLDCKRENDELICLIKKTLLYCYSGSEFERVMKNMPLIYYNEKGNMEEIYLIGYFTFNYNVQKIDVSVKITKLLTHNIGTRSIIVYETNVTNIASVVSYSIPVNFKGKEEDSLDLECYFKKGEYNPLLLLCGVEHEDVLSLNEIENEIRLNDINAKYNFIIQPVKNNETITIINSIFSLPIIYTIYPNILNFTEKNSFEIILYLQGEGTTPLEGITFNEKANDLICQNFERKITCNVPKEHFKGLNNEYYYIKYYNPNTNNKDIEFYVNPIRIILPDISLTIEKNINNDVGKKGAILFEVDYFSYNKYYFDIDIKRETIFKMNISDENNKSYEVGCGTMDL